MKRSSQNGTESELAQARALAEHPELARLRQLEALAEMARSGAKFVIFNVFERDHWRSLGSLGGSRIVSLRVVQRMEENEHRPECRTFLPVIAERDLCSMII